MPLEASDFREFIFYDVGRIGLPQMRRAQALGSFGPLVAAVVLTAQEGGRPGLRSLLGRIMRWRVPPVWYSVVLSGPVLLYLASRCR